MPRILVIDDQPQVRTTISLGLKASGFEVTEADSAGAAMTEMRNASFDVAIVDIFMPGTDGSKTIDMLRAHTPNLPVIAISGVFQKTAGQAAFDFLPMAPEQADVICLQKPFRPGELRQAIDQALRRRIAVS
jgi:CheY-like chemotaxis protein